MQNQCQLTQHYNYQQNSNQNHMRLQYQQPIQPQQMNHTEIYINKQMAQHGIINGNGYQQQIQQNTNVYNLYHQQDMNNNHNMNHNQNDHSQLLQRQQQINVTKLEPFPTHLQLSQNVLASVASNTASSTASTASTPSPSTASFSSEIVRLAPGFLSPIGRGNNSSNLNQVPGSNHNRNICPSSNNSIASMSTNTSVKNICFICNGYLNIKYAIYGAAIDCKSI